MGSVSKTARGVGDGPGDASEAPSKPPPKRRRVASSEQVSVLASECIKLRLVSSAAEILANDLSSSDTLSFAPEFLENYFGSDGKIYGYKGLKVDIWLHARSFHAYADITYASEVKSTSQLSSTDLHTKLQEMFKYGLTTDRETFINNFSLHDCLFEETRLKQGKLVRTWKMSSEPKVANSSTKSDPGTVPAEKICSEIYQFDMCNERVLRWQRRMTSLVLLLIDGATAIDVNDTLWEIYVSMETTPSKRDGGSQRRVTGFAAVYRFYHHPDSTRLRLSQILVLPPYQGKNYGLRLLETINDTAVQRGCYDVTMEDPSESLQTLRDCVDVLRLNSFNPVGPAMQAGVARLKAYAQLGSESVVQFDACVLPSKDLLAAPISLIDDARSKLKITRLQLQRCWEQMVYMHLDHCDPALKRAFKLALMSRLYFDIVGKTKEKKGKCAIDTYSQFSSKTFVMLRATPEQVKVIKSQHEVPGLDNVDADAFEPSLDSEVAEEGRPDPGLIRKEVENLLKERAMDMDTTAKKIYKICKDQGVALEFGMGQSIPAGEKKYVV